MNTVGLNTAGILSLTPPQEKGLETFYFKIEAENSGWGYNIHKMIRPLWVPPLLKNIFKCVEFIPNELITRLLLHVCYVNSLSPVRP